MVLHHQCVLDLSRGGQQEDGFVARLKRRIVHRPFCRLQNSREYGFCSGMTLNHSGRGRGRRRRTKESSSHVVTPDLRLRAQLERVTVIECALPANVTRAAIVSPVNHLQATIMSAFPRRLCPRLSPIGRKDVFGDNQSQRHGSLARHGKAFFPHMRPLLRCFTSGSCPQVHTWI